MNKIIKIVIWSAVAIAIIAGIYLGFRYLKSDQNGEMAPEETDDQVRIDFPFTSPKKITEDIIFDYWLNKKTGEIYYLTDAGGINKIFPSGARQETGSKATGNLSYIKPSADGSMILVAFGFPYDPTFAIYNSGTKSWQALPAGTTAAAWEPNSNNQVAYLQNNGISGRLSLLSISVGKSKELLRLNQKDLDLDWVLPKIIYLKERSSTQTLGSLWSFNIDTKIIRKIISEEPSLITKWSADGSLGLKWNTFLNVVDKNAQTLATLALKTVPSKCVFSVRRIYCAAWSEILTGQVLTPDLTTDDYLKKIVKSQDNIYEIATDNFLKSLIYSAQLNNEVLDAEHLELIGENLYFINRYDKRLYKLEL